MTPDQLQTVQRVFETLARERPETFVHHPNQNQLVIGFERSGGGRGRGRGNAR